MLESSLRELFMKELRLREKMTPLERKEWGEDNPHRIEYAYGSISERGCDTGDTTPIILKVADFWMPLSRAKRIHQWLGKAITECEKRGYR